VFKLFIDIFFVIGAILVIWLGWSTGLVRTFFAVLAGFVATFVSCKYPYHEGLGTYLIFVISAMFVVTIGAFTLRIINFFYLNIFDRIGGVFLNLCIWLIVFINVITPSLASSIQLSKSDSYIYFAIARVVQQSSKIAIFKDYMPLFLSKYQKQ
jgi:hypothetical protein